MDIKFKLEDTTISFAPTYNNTMTVCLSIKDTNDITEILRSIKDKIDIERFIESLDIQDLEKISEYYKTIENSEVE